MQARWLAAGCPFRRAITDGAEPSGVELGHRAPSLCAPFGTPTSDLLGPQGWALPAFCWCVPVSEVSSAFRGQTYHGMSVPRRHTVPWRRLELGRPDLVGKQTFLMGWWSQAACLGLLSQDPSPPQGPPACTGGRGGASPGRMSSILTVRMHVGRFAHRLSQQETLRGSKLVPSPNIFSGTTMKSCICIFFLSL